MLFFLNHVYVREEGIMAKWGRLICANCNVVFVPDLKKQKECFRCLTEHREKKVRDEYEMMRKRHFGTPIITCVCAECGKNFKKHKDLSKLTCSPVCQFKRQSRTMTKNTKEKKISQEQKIKLANEKWLKDEKPEPGRKMPLEVLNRIEEKKRVFDEKGWDHYLKGRKWDKI